MRIRITMPAKDGKRIKEEILNNIEKVEEDDWSEEWELVRSLRYHSHLISQVLICYCFCLHA